MTPVESGKPVQFVSVPLVGVPNNGVTSVGLVANTSEPVPVSSVEIVLRFVLDGVANHPATPENIPETPVDIGSPVQLVNVPLDGVPSAGVTSVGLVANTTAPDPVSPVTAAAKFAVDGVAKNVATSVPNPDTPDAIGNPVQFVSVPDVGVPSKGVVSVGDVPKTRRPVPVSSLITPANCAEVVAANCDNGFDVKASPPPPGDAQVPSPRQNVDPEAPVPELRFATGRFPVTPVVNGKPVALVSTPALGVPRFGVTSTGDVFITNVVPVPV